MFNLKKREREQTVDNRITFKDFVALTIAFIQLLYPYILISLGVFIFLMWILATFWVR